MAKSSKTNPTIENIDLDEEAKKVDDFGDDDMIDLTQVATTLPATGLNVMDFTEFASGIEDVTLESEDFIKALLYGPNGTGKNTIANTFPGPRLVLDINERGTRSMVGVPDTQKRKVDTVDMFMMAYWFLKSGNHNFKTVILDNVTTLQEVFMKSILKKESDFDMSKDIDMPTKRDWGGLSQMMKRWMIDFRNLPMNVVFIAQEKKLNDDDLESDEVSVFPQVSASARSILSAAVDVIGRTYVTEVSHPDKPEVMIAKYCMRITPNSRFQAKIRIPVGATTPASIVNPSYAALKKIMNGGYNKKGV